MSSDPVVLPVDYTGTAPSNRIRGEQHVLNRTDLRDHRVVIPKLAPFYNNQTDKNEKLKLVLHNPNSGTQRLLIEGKDYYPVFYFITASTNTARPVFGGIEILDHTLEGVLHFEYYQSLGGQWTITPEKILEILSDLKYNPRRKAWEQIVDLPERFPPVDHDYELVDWTGAKDLTNAIYSIRDLMLASTGAGVEAHIRDKNNPHGVTKAQVLLAMVMNYPIATKLQAERGIDNEVYMTSLRTAEAIAEQATKPLLAHIAEKNPHNAVPADFGAASLEQLAEKLDKTGTAANSRMFAGLTFAEAAVEILKGTAFNSDRLGGYTAQEILSMVAGGTAENALKLDGKTLDEIMASIPDYLSDKDLHAATATDSRQLDGMTGEEWRTYIDDKTSAMGPDATTPAFDTQGLVSFQRMFFSGHRFFPLYRFSLDDLKPTDFPENYIGDHVHSFIVVPTLYNHTDTEVHLFTVTTRLDLTIAEDAPNAAEMITIGASGVRKLSGDDKSNVRFYVRKIGTKVFEVVVDKMMFMGQGVVDQQMASLSIMNVNAFSRFIGVHQVFHGESFGVLPANVYTGPLEYTASTGGYKFTNTINLAAGGSQAMVGMPLDLVIDMLVEDPDEPGVWLPYYPWLAVERREQSLTVRNDSDKALKIQIMAR